jgi:biofilm PGA synthesis protein PgaD
MKANEQFISHPGRGQPRTRRTLYSLATFAIWAVYLYLWLPLITLLVWVLGLRSTYLEMYLAQQRIDPAILVLLPVLALVCGLALIGWAEYNRRRFGHLDRRESRPNVTHEEIALALHADPAMAVRLRASKRVVLHMSEDARPLGLSPGLAAPVPGPPGVPRVEVRVEAS